MKKDHLSDKAAFAYLSLFAFIIVLFISPDSYTHDVFFRVDSSCFFMAGKAWMNGMVPYVDFADSKGPLLWLIYGIGYLISHYNYIGVFWLSVINYAITYFLTFKAAMIVVGDSKRAFLCAVLMSAAFFYPHVFYEMRAENFGHPFMMLTLYHTLRIIMTKEPKQRQVCHSFFAYGIAFGGTLLIKYSFTVMLAPMMCYGLYWLIREKRKVVLPILYGLIGLMVIVVPFLIYFIIAGNLGAFIQEYFINTLQTIQPEGNPLLAYLQEWNIVRLRFIFVLLVLLMTGAIATATTMRKYRMMPIVCTLFMFAIAVRHSGYFFAYYFTAPCICMFFLVSFVVSKIHINWRPLALAGISALVIAISVTLSIHSKPLYHNLAWNNSKYRADVYNMAYIIDQIDHPKVIDLCSCGIGVETLPGALPGCKYWVKQKGSTPQMLAAHWSGVLAKTADFIYVKSSRWMEEDGFSVEDLEAAGYHLCYECFGARLYTKHDIGLPKHHPTPSNWDILLKRPWRK